MGGLIGKVDELIIIKQLPVIEDRLDEAYAAVQERLAGLSSLVVTEENYKDLKKLRADLNKELSDLETLRKKIKSAVEQPYKSFEAGAYKRIADEYKSAIASLDADIKDTEEVLRSRRWEEIYAYFEEYRASLGISASLVSLEKSGIKVGLSGSAKSYKDQVRVFLDRVYDELETIGALEYADEVMVEYGKSLNLTEAIRITSERRKRIEEERARREAEEERKKQAAATVAEVEEAVSVVSVSPEVDENQQEDIENKVYSVSFLGYTIYGTEEQLTGLKKYLKDEMVKYLEKEGIDYE